MGSAASSLIAGLGAKPSKILTKMLSKYKKIVYSLTLFGERYKQIVTLTTFTDSSKNSLQLLNQLFFSKLCLIFGLLVYSFKYTEIWQAWSVNWNFVVSLKTKILTERKFWFANFTKICLMWSAKRQVDPRIATLRSLIRTLH